MTSSAAPSVPEAGQPVGGPVPAHVAIIMDGNGRWAKARGMPRAIGHERGVEALRRTVDAAAELGIKCLTVFSFSTENWSRPADEVNALFGLLRIYVNRDLKRLDREGVRIRIIGLREGLPSDILDLIEKAEKTTENNSKLHLTIAFNYGARAEILAATAALMRDAVEGKIDPDALTEADFSAKLSTAGLPEPDLLIRTSGEHRISNFLLWQLAYTEMVFVDIFWPDFGPENLARATEQFARRERRFGAVQPGAS